MLELRDLRKRFSGREVLSCISLSVAPGEVYGLLGPNGSGKSTTLKIAAGLVQADAGNVIVGGVDQRVDRMGALRRLGAQIEAPGFPGHLTGRRNLQLLAQVQGLSAKLADALVDEVGLGEAAGRKVEGYSTGMRQRLGIAAALLGDPPVLILDEPASGLDPEGQEAMLSLLERLVAARRPAVLITSHHFDEVARLCDRIGILQEGRLVHEGPAEDAQRLRAVYFAQSAGSSEAPRS